MMMNGRSNSRYPFTASQWQELEHQALIFKYLASGHPVPSDLILPIRRSIFLDSTTSHAASLFPHQPNIGWGCFQMGFGRKAEDPEPGRCRRTDGKKWRCSKEAHPDSKYCERHMHRGKNRSRKPVEMTLNTAAAAATNAASSNPPPYASSLYPPHLPLSMVGPDAVHGHSGGVGGHLYPYSSSYSSRPVSIGLSPQFHLDSAGSSSADRDYRYLHGLKEEVDQYGCFSEAGAGRDGSWRFTPLGLGGDPKPRGCSSYLQQNGGYSQFSIDLHKDEGGEEKHHHPPQQQQQQHCFVLGTDFKEERPTKGADNGREEEEEESQKPLRRFFDEWPPKSKESWIGLEEEERSNSNWSSSTFSKTQLSISTPMTQHDLSLQW